jgi:hypothetical protein
MSDECTSQFSSNRSETLSRTTLQHISVYEVVTLYLCHSPLITMHVE